MPVRRPPLPEGRIVVISGTSGAGKTTVTRRLLEDPRFARARTATTRAPRGEEQDGVDYDFLSPAEFQAAVERGDLLEHAEVYGRRYGTPRANVEEVLASGRVCVLVVDVQGARSLRALPLRAYYVFVDAPSEAVLRQRLEKRGEDSPEAIERRIAVARREREAAPLFDRVLVNDDIDETARRLAAAAGLEYEPVRGAAGRE